MSVDKSQVREDYLRGFSVRMLAAKYGVPKSTVSDWVKKYGWVQEAKPRTIREMLEAGQDEPDRKPDGEPDSRTVSGPLPVSEDYSMLRERTVKLLRKADDLLELDDALAPRDLKSLSSMLLDVRALLNVLSPREAAEQEMRLLALKRSVEKEENASEPVVVEFVNMEGTDA